AVAQRWLDERRRAALLAVRARVGPAPVIEPRLRRNRLRQRIGTDRPHDGVRLHVLAHLGAQLVAALGVDPTDLLLDQAAEAVDPDLLDDVLHPRATAILALDVAVLDTDDRLAPDEQVVGRNEVGDVLGQEWLRAQSPTRVDREPARAIAHLGVDPDVVHRRLGAILRAALDGDLELPRQGQV